MTSLFKVNKLYSLPSRSTEQRAGPEGKAVFCFLFFHNPPYRSPPLLECYWVGSSRLCFLFLLSLCQMGVMGSKSCSIKGKLGRLMKNSLCLDRKPQTGKLGIIIVQGLFSGAPMNVVMRKCRLLFCQMGSTTGVTGSPWTNDSISYRK